MNQANKIIQLLIIALNGAFIGAMVFIALVVVPFWQASEPQFFFDWFSSYGQSIGKLMIPLGPGVLILAIITFVMSKGNRILWGLTTIFLVANILYFPIYYLPTNNAFAEQTIEANALSNVLSTWLKLHWQRIFFAIGALIASIFAVIKSQSENNV